jgi:hypothetical protein
MSGLNFARVSTGLDAREIKSIPDAYIDETMIAYCQLHPQDDYAFGVTFQIYRQRPLVPGSQAKYQQRPGG